MTQEEKARAYDEALERAKKYNIDDAYSSQGTIVKLIFPELAENEDEGILASIADCVGLMGEDSDVFSNHNVTKVQVLSWLEKQKENPKSDDFIPSNCVSDAKCEDRSPKHSDSDGTDIRDTPAYWRGWDDAMKQKEQKPVDYDHEMWKNCEANFEGGKKEVIEHPEKYGLQKEQKPVDLSEMMVHKEPYIAPVPTPMVADEQNPAEWSEEDEASYNAFICEVVNEKMNPTIEQVKWLRGICDRLKSLHPQPHWKPSEEQLKELNKARRFIPYNCDILESLYNQLKSKKGGII